MGCEDRGSGEYRPLAFRVDFPNEVAGRVGDVGIAGEVDGNIVRGGSVGGGGRIKEGSEEEALARPEVIGSKSIEGRGL